VARKIIRGSPTASEDEGEAGFSVCSHEVSHHTASAEDRKINTRRRRQEEGGRLRSSQRDEDGTGASGFNHREPTLHTPWHGHTDLIQMWTLLEFKSSQPRIIQTDDTTTELRLHIMDYNTQNIHPDTWHLSTVRRQRTDMVTMTAPCVLVRYYSMNYGDWRKNQSTRTHIHRVMTMWYFSFSFLINLQKLLDFSFFLSRWGTEWTLMRNKMSFFDLSKWLKHFKGVWVLPVPTIYSTQHIDYDTLQIHTGTVWLSFFFPH